MARVKDKHILRAALGVIAQKGYVGATTREISAAAGINEVTLFRRFGSKHNLLMAAVAQELENFKAAQIEYSGDLEADLVKVVTFYDRLMTHRADVLAMLISEAPRQPELLEVMQVPLQIIGRIRLILERYMREGRLAEEPPQEALAALVGPLFLGGIVRYLQPGMLDVNFEPQALVERFLAGRGMGVDSIDDYSIDSIDD